jgi:2-dehydro-3-deoxygluconokinase
MLDVQAQSHVAGGKAIARIERTHDRAGEVMAYLAGMCDVAIGNEEDADKVFGIQAPEANVTTGQVEADQYRCVCEQLAQRFHRLKTIAITLRGPLSTSHNTWSGVLWDKSEFYTAPTYDILSIVDRVGGAMCLWAA